jgi:tRNA pseudouridine55 synthase
MQPTTSDGILLVDKPAGMTSHDAVSIVRRARGRVRTGHTGTLDPFATGLLLVTCGRATRLARFLPSEPKTYDARIVFGASTDTDDATGTVVETAPVPDEAAVRAAIARLTGELSQVPPAYSAKHKDGRRAYALARAGIDPGLPPVAVQVHAWDAVRWEPPDLLASITTGSGTYIRALARDLGRLTGSAAHLAALRRVRIGPFAVTAACPPDEAGHATLLTPAEALAGLPRQEVSTGEAVRVRHGRAVAARIAGDLAALVDHDGALLAVAEREAEWWQPRVVLDAA